MISREVPPLERVEQLAVLYDLASTVGRAAELEVIYRAALLAIDRGLRAEKSSILLFDPDGVMRFKYWQGLSDAYRSATEGHTPWRQDHPSPAPVVVEDVLADPELEPLREVITAERIRALAFFPLVARGRLLGKFMIYYSEPHTFTQDEIRMAEIIAGHVASSIERQLNEESILASEEQFSKAFHASPVGLSIVRASDRCFLDVNESFLNLLGYTRDEVIGKCVDDVGIWAEGERDKAAEMLANRGFARHAEAKLQTKSGQVRNVLGSMEVITVRGEICVLSLVVDITDRRRAEDTLAFQKALLEAQSEASVDGILVVAPGGEMLSFNRRFVEMWRLPEAVVESRSDDAAIKAVLDQLVDPEQFTSRIEYLYGHPNEESRDLINLKDGRVFERYSRPLTGSESEYFGRVWYFQDVTDRIRQEERDALLAEAGAVLASSLDGATILSGLAELMVKRFANLVWVHVREGEQVRRMTFASDQSDKTQRYVEVSTHSHPGRDSNHPVLRVLSTHKAELWGSMPDDQLATAARDSGHLEMLRKLDIQSAIIVPIMVAGVAKGALTFARNSSRAAFTQADMALAEDLAARVGVALDNARLYEESLKMQQDLIRLNEAKDEFLGMVSHELRTPITTIYGGARVLHDRQNISEEDRRGMLSDIIDESERLRRLIEDLLVLARVELGDGVPTEPVQIQAAIQKQVDVLLRRMPGRKVELNLESGLPPVLASPTYLEQVFRNLIDNAIKYSPPETAIQFSTRRHNEGEIVVAVASGGAEVPAEDIERMFERFYRAKSAADQKTGAGIGLTVCRRLVEAQNGAIWAEAQAGGGLKICFTLPFCRE